MVFSYSITLGDNHKHNNLQEFLQLADMADIKSVCDCRRLTSSLNYSKFSCPIQKFHISWNAAGSSFSQSAAVKVRGNSFSN